MTTTVPEIDIDAFAARAADAYLIDVREPEEYAAGHVPSARPLPLSALPQATGPLPHDRTVYVICASGNRSRRAASLLRERGLDAVSVAGGTGAWVRTGRPVATGTR